MFSQPPFDWSVEYFVSFFRPWKLISSNMIILSFVSPSDYFVFCFPHLIILSFVSPHLIILSFVSPHLNTLSFVSPHLITLSFVRSSSSSEGEYGRNSALKSAVIYGNGSSKVPVVGRRRYFLDLKVKLKMSTHCVLHSTLPCSVLSVLSARAPIQ